MSKISLAVLFGLVLLLPQRMRMLGMGQVSNSNLTLLHQANFTDQGAFLTPGSCGDSLQFGASGLAFNPAGSGGAGSLYLTTHDLHVVEVSLATPVNSSNLGDLNTGSCLQNAVDPTEGLWQTTSADTGSGLGPPTALGVVGSTLWIVTSAFYDSGATQALSLISRPNGVALSATGQAHGAYGLSSVTSGYHPSFASRSFAAISSDWTAAMGGDIFTGKFNSNIITSESAGPAAIVANASTLTDVNGIQLTTVSVANSDNSYNDSSASLPLFTPGTTVWAYDQDTAGGGNSGTVTVVSSTVSKLVVSGLTLSNQSAGHHFAFGRVYPAANTPLFYTTGTSPAGNCGTVGDDVANGVVQCSNPGGFVGGTFGAVYKYWSAAAVGGGLAQPKGTRTLVVTEIMGAAHATYGGYGYGCGCASTITTPGQLTCNGADPGGCGASGEGYFYDPPNSGSKGNHGYPYDYMFVLYDMNDLQAVVNGSKNPGDLRPYEWFTWTFPVMPGPTGTTAFSSPGMDQTHGYLYIAQVGGPNSQWPIIHRIHIQ